MIFGEKFATVGGEQKRIKNALRNETRDSFSFGELVDEACEKLRDRQIKYSIRRIHEMNDCLRSLEKELDDFLLQKGELQ